MRDCARALHEPPITQAEAHEAGFELEDYDTEEVVIWPENELAVQMFCRIGTRWRYMARGMQGAMFVAGVQWEAVYPLLDRLGLSADDWADLLQQLEVMEQAALPVIRGAMASKTK